MSREKSLPFFQVLHTNKTFEWTPECEEAFQSLKRHLRTLPELDKPLEGDTFYFYLSVGQVVVSSVLIKKENRAHVLVYFVRKVLN